MNYILYKAGGSCSVEAIRTRLPDFVQELIVIFWVIMYDEVNNRLRGGKLLKYIKLLLVVLVILTAVSVLMGHQNNMPIMFIMLAISHAVNGWERYHKNKIEGIVLWTTAIFTAIFSVSLYFF